MTPPEAPRIAAGNTPPAVFACDGGMPVSKFSILHKRSDFLAAARAQRQGTGTMMVQGRDRQDGDPEVRVGYTCSKKVGNSVTRNRAKRRLRAIAREVLPGLAQPGWDYVLIGRAGETAVQPYAALRQDLTRALLKLGRPR